MFDSINISGFPENQSCILRPPSSTRPTIWSAEENGVHAVVKDFRANGFFFRNVVGRFLVWRESKAYKKLKGIKGIPALYKEIDGLVLVVEEIPGRNLENLEKELRLPESFFDALKDLVDRFHKRGLAHCDLKRAPNVLLGHDGCPYLVDWSAAISASEFRLPLLNFVYQRFLLDDYMAIIKLKLRHIPEAVTLYEQKCYNHRSGAEKLIRSIRDWLRDILQKIV